MRYKGVTKYKRNKDKPWRAKLYMDGKVHHIGYYSDPLEAHKAWVAFRDQKISESISTPVGTRKKYTRRPKQKRTGVCLSAKSWINKHKIDGKQRILGRWDSEDEAVRWSIYYDKLLKEKGIK